MSWYTVPVRPVARVSADCEPQVPRQTANHLVYNSPKTPSQAGLFWSAIARTLLQPVNVTLMRERLHRDVVRLWPRPRWPRRTPHPSRSLAIVAAHPHSHGWRVADDLAHADRAGYGRPSGGVHGRQGALGRTRRL